MKICFEISKLTEPTYFENNEVISFLGACLAYWSRSLWLAVDYPASFGSLTTKVCSRMANSTLLQILRMDMYPMSPF